MQPRMTLSCRLLRVLMRAPGDIKSSWSRYRLAVFVHRQLSSKEYEGGVQFTESLHSHVQRLVEQHHRLVDRMAIGSEMSSDDLKRSHRALSELEPVVKLAEQLKQKHKLMTELESLASVPELAGEAKSDMMQCQEDIKQIKSDLVNALLPRDAADNSNAILEVRAGAGGQEASLFTATVYQMYQKYSAFKGWQFEALSMLHAESGGYKSASASITGNAVFGMMKYETGVHRVQRIPVTESHGRVHTSTMTVAVLPQPSEIEIQIKDDDIKLDTFRSSGAGGQHVNTTDSAVRVTHLPSGIVVSMQEERSQHKNRAKAMKVLRARLYDQKRIKEEESRKQQRRKQIGTAGRSEKIRTYNYPQDRVTDHRLKRTVNGVISFTGGAALLDSMIHELRAQDEALLLSSLVD